MSKEKQVIACWGISNVASLNVWEMQSDESMLVGINDDEPEWIEIEWRIDPESDDEENNSMAGIDYHGSFYRLDDCMRVTR
ncbi:hypothetical protein BSK59_15625 [Paenibacillus odorifer]|uniref:hypothetical protein n=1 Tax=Paenibacillus odorifer TaxID=189426 RepID=UPI00096F2732|nr:hypothetical protein [Paenibacillus odorifer]OME54009.1 hypothetical protein BSK59_15625 [Paenibacillus odorifer]